MTWTEDELLGAFRAERGPSASARARLEARIHEIATTPTTTQRQQATSPWLRRGTVVAIAVAAAIVGTCALAPQEASEQQGDVPALVPDAARSGAHDTGQAQPSRPLSPPPAARQPASAALETPPLNPAMVPAPAQARPADRATSGDSTVDPRRPQARPAAEPKAQPDATTITEEAAAIGRARAALTKGQRQSALDELVVYRRRFPNPVLGEEAAAVEAMAECHGATADVAAASARAFAAAHPGSLFRKQVQRSCSTALTKNTPMQRPREDVDIQE